MSEPQVAATAGEAVLEGIKFSEARFPSETGSATADVVIDPEQERKLVRKLDLFIIPMIMITFFFSFLDRTNIGNAQVAGLSADLMLHGSQFNGEWTSIYLLWRLIALFFSGRIHLLRHLHYLRDPPDRDTQVGRPFKTERVLSFALYYCKSNDLKFPCV
jgi:hypothetical protein